MAKTTPLMRLVQTFVEKDPAGTARRLEAMTSEEAVSVLKPLSLRLKGLIFPHLQVGHAAALLAAAEAKEFEAIVRALDPARAASVFMRIPEDARARLVSLLPDRVRRQTGELLAYPEDSVGRMMTTQFLSLNRDLKVREATRRIRELAKGSFPASYAYVVGDNDELVGVMNMRDLLVAEGTKTLADVMRKEVFVLKPFLAREEAAAELSRRKYFAAPVVDSENRILGIVKAEHLFQNARQEIGQDLQKMFGAGGDEAAFSPIRYSLRKRLPWLHVNLATAFLAAGVVALFEDTIARLTVLAVFLPVVAGQGGNAGAQSLAIVMRGLVMREIPRDRYGRLVLKEGLLGTINGLVIGVVTALVAWAWYGSPALGLVVALGMVVNLVAAGLSGASIPIVLKSVGLDPAQCSSIILTTVTDVIGFFAFLGFAAVFEGYLA